MARVLVKQPEKIQKQQKEFTLQHVGPDGKVSRRLIPLNARQALKVKQWEIDYRFVREVEFLERDGRVDSRAKLELAVGLEVGGVASIRNGMRGATVLNIVLLFELYRGDRDFIELNAPRNSELYKPYIPNLGRLNIHEPYYHRYTRAARWRVGARPETRTPHPNGTAEVYSAYFPDDPENLEWSAPNRMSIKDIEEGRDKDTGKDDE